MNYVWQSLLTCICITAPENIFLIILTLRFMGRKEMLDLYNIKENLISILKIILPPSLLINFLNFLSITPLSINKLISFIVLYLLLIYLLKKHSFIDYPKLYIKTFTYFVLSILIAIAIEIITLPIIFKLVNKTFQEIKVDIYLIIICSLSSRIVDLVILLYIFLKKNSRYQIDIMHYIFNNKIFFKLLMVLVIGLIILEVYFIKLILLNNLLSIIPSIYEQMLLVVSFTFLIPSVIISIFYSCINYCVTVINCEKQNN